MKPQSRDLLNRVKEYIDYALTEDEDEDTNTIILELAKALTNITSKVNCQCNEYNGYTCPIHKDFILSTQVEARLGGWFCSVYGTGNPNSKNIKKECPICGTKLITLIDEEGRKSSIRVIEIDEKVLSLKK